MWTLLKMFRKCGLLLCLTAAVLAEGEVPGKPKESSVTRLVGKRQQSAPKARTQWGYHAVDDSYRQASEGISHGYAAHGQGLSVRATETPGYTSSVAEYWRPGSTNLTLNSAYSYSRPYSGSTATGSYTRDALRGTHSSFQYQTRPSQPLKKIHPHYLIGKLHSSDGSPKTKYKKTVLYQSPSIPTTYKKPLHPRVHKPYAKHKYPIQKTVHPPHRRYYQSPYQRYAIPLTDILRHKLPTHGDYAHQKTSPSSPTSPSDSYHTTERMDDAYPDGSAPSEDYSPRDTQHNASGNYYDAYEEPDKTPDPDPSYDETTTRNYYGDRIYMSTQLPLTAPDKPTTRNSYYVLRRTSDDDDDIETIFE